MAGGDFMEEPLSGCGLFAFVPVGPGVGRIMICHPDHRVNKLGTCGDVESDERHLQVAPVFAECVGAPHAVPQPRRSDIFDDPVGFGETVADLLDARKKRDGSLPQFHEVEELTVSYTADTSGLHARIDADVHGEDWIAACWHRGSP